MKYILSILFFTITFLSFGQADSVSTKTFVSGIVTDVNGRRIPDAMVINRTTGRGVFAEGDGSYLIEIDQEDEVQIGSLGYSSVLFSFADSTFKPQYTKNIVLSRLQVNVPEAQVIAPRELKEIIEDIETLGYDEEEFKVSGINALESPITYLYQTFSKREQSKRKAIEFENRDRRRELLKELFVKYVEYDIIQLDDDEFDDFIEFMDPGDEVLQSMTQYQFILFTKERFIDWQYRKKELMPSDYQYHLDDD